MLDIYICVMENTKPGRNSTKKFYLVLKERKSCTGMKEYALCAVSTYLMPNLVFIP